jgi:hypothetical protein
MHITLKGYHRKPTYDELIQEAVIHPTETIKYPNRIATHLRTTPQLTRFDDESFLDMNTINSNAAKQNIQQTAYQRAVQPMSRSSPSGPEQFDIADTDEKTPQQIDDVADDLEEGRRVRARRESYLHGILENELADPTQIDDMMATSSARGQSKNLRGTSSASSLLTSGSILSLHPAGSSVSTGSGSYLSASSGSSGVTGDIPFEEIEPIPLDIQMGDLQALTDQHIVKLQQTGRNNTETERLEKILNSIVKIRTKMRKQEQTPVMVKEYSILKGVLISTLNEAQ